MKAILTFLMLCYGITSFAMSHKPNWDNAIDNAVQRYGLRVEPHLIRYFKKAGISYPPKEIALLAFKSERKVELWAIDSKKTWTHVHNYPLTGYSGRLG